jgi:hypothetical protein
MSNWNPKKEKLREELKALELAVAKVRAKLELIEEIESEEQGHSPATSASHLSEIEQLMAKPSVKLADAVRDAAVTLRQFTIHSLVNSIIKKYPNYPFQAKSVRKPLQDLIDDGEVKMIKENIGSRSPAVYEFKAKSSVK